MRFLVRCRWILCCSLMFACKFLRVSGIVGPTYPAMAAARDRMRWLDMVVRVFCMIKAVLVLNHSCESCALDGTLFDLPP
jgi:hypothetical protein